MQLHKLILPVLFIFIGFKSFGQVITTTPILPTKNDTITLIYYADLGNGALKGTSPVFAHTGTITSKSVSGSDWRHLVGTWGIPDTTVLMTSVSPNVYKMVIPIKSFYGIGDEEEVRKLAFVFRNADGSLVGRNTDGSDLYVPLDYEKSRTENPHPTNTNLKDTTESLPLRYSIAGIIQNVDDVNVSLIRFSESGLETVNKSQLINGEFSMRGSLAVPENFSLMIGDNDILSSIPILLGADSVSIVADYQNLPETEITGAPLNEEAKKYFKRNYFNQPPEHRRDAEVGELTIQAPNFNDGFISPEFIQREKNALLQYVKEHPASPVSPYLVLQARLLFEFSYDELKTLDAYYDSTLNKSPDLIIIRDNMTRLEPVSVDKEYTDFSLPDTSGQMINISDYAGKCILIEFWASWCAPCLGKFPKLKNTYQKYKDEGFTIIGVSFDMKPDHWKRAILKEQLDWVQLVAPEAAESEIAKRYVVWSIPANILIAPDGIIVGRNLQSFELNEKLMEIFGF